MQRCITGSSSLSSLTFILTHCRNCPPSLLRRQLLPAYSTVSALKIDYSGDRITLVQFLKECLYLFIVEDPDQKWSTFITLNWKVILETQNLEQPLNNRHMGSRNRDWERLNTSWGCGDTIIWDLTGLDKSFGILNTTPVLQAELNPNTHATAMIKYSSYSVKCRYKQQNSIIWWWKKTHNLIDRNWGSGGWKGHQSITELAKEPRPLWTTSSQYRSSVWGT